MKKKLGTQAISMGIAAVLAAAILPDAVSAKMPGQSVTAHQDQGPRHVRKVELEYMAFPDTLFVDRERQMAVCVVNHGGDGELVYDGARNRDQIVISIPVGPEDNELTEEPLLLGCSSERPDWHCLGPNVWADKAFLTFRPNGAVSVAEGETLCFQITALNVNAAVGLAELRVHQQIAWRRAKLPMSWRIAVFKTDLQPIAHDDLAEVTPDQHHEKTTSFAELTDQATDVQIPDDITVNFTAAAGTAGFATNADMVDGMHADELMQDMMDQWVNEEGDTMTGPLTLAGPPVEPLHAATKAYVDEAGAGMGAFKEGFCEDLRMRKILPPPSMGCGFKIVFLSSRTYRGLDVSRPCMWNQDCPIMGLDQADAHCQSMADEAGLEGTFKAWLGYKPNQDPEHRFTKSDKAYIRTDGVTVAQSWADLTDGYLENPINVDQNGNKVEDSKYVWTGTGPKGTALDRSCNGWTSASDSDRGEIGAYVGTDVHWTYSVIGDLFGKNHCDDWHHIYCFQQ